MYDRKDNLSEIIIAVFAILLGTAGLVSMCYVYGVFVSGFVISKFWVWFLMPIFSEIPKISIWQGVGLSYFVIAIFPKRIDILKDEKEREIDFSKFAFKILGPWLLLFFGWLLKVCFL